MRLSKRREQVYLYTGLLKIKKKTVSDQQKYVTYFTGCSDVYKTWSDIWDTCYEFMAMGHYKRIPKIGQHWAKLQIENNAPLRLRKSQWSSHWSRSFASATQHAVHRQK